jgi:hypothetical protein
MPAQAPLPAAITGFGMSRLLPMGHAGLEVEGLARLRVLPQPLHVHPGAEGPARPGADHDPDGGVLGGLFEEREEAALHGELHAFSRSGRCRVTVATPPSST